MFKDYDVVCFFGDSITSNGLWLAEIYQYLRKKYKIKCYNCGVSGGMTVRAKPPRKALCQIAGVVGARVVNEKDPHTVA